MKKGIITILSVLTGAAVGAGAVKKVESEKLNKMRSMSNKHLELFKMMSQWVKVKQEGKNLSSYADVDIVSIDDDLEEVDAVVVTAITFFDEIEEKLSQKIDCPIISLEDILYEI